MEDQLRWLMMRIKRRYLIFETLYMEMKNASVLVNQIVFFSLCERIFLLPSQRMSSLYTLMFFNVIAYSFSYVKELAEREDWSMYVNITSTSNVHHLGLSTTRIVLEWTKAVTFLITVVFTLLVFGLETGLKDYAPTAAYLLITGAYFIMTEKVFIKMFSSWLDYMKFDYFEGMEVFYCPGMLLSMQITLSSFFVLLCFVCGHFRLVMLSTFTNIRVKYRELRDRCLQPLNTELSNLSCFRVASPSEIQGHDDVCAICLMLMSCARITPCQHFFHADCLRRCLKESYKCPICQYDLHRAQLLMAKG